MGRRKIVIEDHEAPVEPVKRRKASTREGRESQCIALAYDLAEERLRNGSATSQEVTHFLKMGSTREQLEREVMELQKELIKAKSESYETSKRIEAMLSDGFNALKSYQSTFSTRAEEDKHD